MNFLIESIKSRFKHKRNGIGIFSVTVFCVLLAAILYLTLKNGIGIYMIGIVLGIAVILFYIKYPKYWIYSIALISFLFFTPSDQGVGIIDIFYGGFVIAGSMIWIFWKIFVQKEKIIENIADWSILFFYIFVILNLPIALSNNISFMDWVREYILLSSLLIYYPVKYYLKEKKDFQYLLIAFGISMMILSYDHFRYYKSEAISQAVYAFQLGTSVRSHQALFCSGIFFSILFFVTSKKNLLKIVFILCTAIFAGVLLLSFSRTFWFFAFFEVLLFLIYITRKQRILLIVGLLVIALLGSVTLVTVFKGNSKIMMQIIENRAVSATKGTKDLSFHLRLLEYEQAEKGIKSSPFGGTGLGGVINFYEPVNHLTFHTKNIHNGYYFFIMSLGLPLTIFLFFPGIYYIITGEPMIRKSKDTFYKSILLASVCSIVIILTGNLLSNQLMIREGAMILGISYGLISSIRNQLKQSGEVQVT